MSEEHIIVRRDGAVLEVQFNRPEKKNAITNAMYGAMADAITEAERNDDIRAVLFSSVGDFFSAGNDIKDFAAQSSGAFEGPRHVGRFLEVVIKAEKPIIAAVQGHAVGVGTTMLFQCDLVYIAEDARLTVPFIDLGVVPENASSASVTRARLRSSVWVNRSTAATPRLGASPTRRCRLAKCCRVRAPPHRSSPRSPQARCVTPRSSCAIAKP